MRVSGNEVKVTIAKATVGVGLPIGIGQDLGHSAQHMMEHHACGLDSFVKAFDAIDKNEDNNFEVVLLDTDSNGDPDKAEIDKNEDGTTDVVAYDYNEDGEWDKFENT